MAERRPIGAREFWISIAAARALARAGVGANAISIGGLLCAGLGGSALAATATAGPGWAAAFWVGGALCVQLRLLANMLDGMVAVESGRTSRLGELYNDVPDRFADAAILIGLGYAAGGHVVLGYAATAAAILTAYVRALGVGVGARAEFCGPMAKPHRMHVVTIAALWSAFAPVGEWPAPATLALIIVAAGSILTALRRLLRIARTVRERP